MSNTLDKMSEGVNVADCHITVLQRQVYVVEVTEYIGLVCKHYNKLFIVKSDMGVVCVFSKNDFNLIFEFIQTREIFASRKPTDFGINECPTCCAPISLAKSQKSR